MLAVFCTYVQMVPRPRPLSPASLTTVPLHTDRQVLTGMWFWPAILLSVALWTRLSGADIAVESQWVCLAFTDRVPSCVIVSG